jgi:cell division protein FtsB
MKRFLQMVFFALLAIIAVAAVVLVFPAFHKYSAIKKRQLEAKKELKKQTNECLILRKKLDNIENNDTEIEKISREKFNYCKEGETVYKFNSKEEAENLSSKTSN